MTEPKYAYLVKRMQRLQLLRAVSCRRAISNIDLHTQQLPILEYIIDNDNCTQIELADALKVSAQSIALSTKRMSCAGLLVKHVDENNLRCKKLSATAHGKDIAKECREVFDDLDERMCRSITEEQIRAMCKLLDTMAQNLCDDELSGLSLSDLRAMVCGDVSKANKKLDNEEE